MTGRRKHKAVAAYLLNALDPDELAEFEEHLIGCARCRRELDELAAVVQMLDHAVRLGLLEGQVEVTKWNSRRRRWTLAAICCAVTVCVAIVRCLTCRRARTAGRPEDGGEEK